MDWYPLVYSLGISAAATVIVLPFGLMAARGATRLPPPLRGALDVLCTLPLVLSPAVVGYLLLQLWTHVWPLVAPFISQHSLDIAAPWWAAVLAAAVVSFPLMYHSIRRAFETFDPALTHAAQTLGRSNIWIFWRLQFPCCKRSFQLGAILVFLRSLGEYGATSVMTQSIPGETSPVAMVISHMQSGENTTVLQWVLVDLALSAVLLILANLLGRRAVIPGAGKAVL